MAPDRAFCFWVPNRGNLKGESGSHGVDVRLFFVRGWFGVRLKLRFPRLPPGKYKRPYKLAGGRLGGVAEPNLNGHREWGAVVRSQGPWEALSCGGPRKPSQRRCALSNTFSLRGIDRLFSPLMIR